MDLQKAKLNLCHLTDVLDGQSEISSSTRHLSQVTGHHACAKALATAKPKRSE